MNIIYCVHWKHSGSYTVIFPLLVIIDGGYDQFNFNPTKPTNTWWILSALTIRFLKLVSDVALEGCCSKVTDKDGWMCVCVGFGGGGRSQTRVLLSLLPFLFLCTVDLIPPCGWAPPHFFTLTLQCIGSGQGSNLPLPARPAGSLPFNCLLKLPRSSSKKKLKYRFRFTLKK